LPNALEQLQCLEELKTCSGALQAMMFQEAVRIMGGFRLPGEWFPARLFEAYRWATMIRKEIQKFNDCPSKKSILMKIAPLEEMCYQR
jgi:hypothetical protein